MDDIFPGFRLIIGKIHSIKIYGSHVIKTATTGQSLLSGAILKA